MNKISMAHRAIRSGAFILGLSTVISTTSVASSDPVASANTGYVIHNGETGYCLGIHAGSTRSGEDAVVGRCTSDSSQVWHAIATTTIGGKTYHQYRNGHSGLC